MSGSIEMDGIHDVVEALQGIVGNQMDVLIPVGAAHQHNVVGIILANLTDNLSGILL